MDSSEPDLTVSVEMEETPTSQIRGRRIGSFGDSTHGNFFECIFLNIFILTSKLQTFFMYHCIIM